MKEFKLTRQPDWPHSDICAPFSFQYIGGGPNLLLLCSALSPRTGSGNVDQNCRILLNTLFFYFNTSQIRNKRVDDPRFGKYRMIWRSQEDIAAQSGLTTTQTKRAISRLVDGGIIASIRSNLRESNSYRLTDEAFMMAHAMQYPALKVGWLNHRGYATYPHLSDWAAFANHMPPDKYKKSFASFMMCDDLRPLVDGWHKQEHATGRRLTPDEFGLVDFWEGVVQGISKTKSEEQQDHLEHQDTLSFLNLQNAMGVY